MSGAFSALKSLDTVQLDVHLKVSLGAAEGEAFVSLKGLDPRDLLGDLGELLRNVEGLSDPEKISKVILAGLQEFAEVFAISGLETVDRVLDLLRTLLSQIGPVIEELGDQPEALFDRVLSEHGGLEGLIAEVVSRFAEGFPAELPEPIRVPAAAVQQLAGGKLQNGRDLAQFLSGFGLGLDLSSLEAPMRVVEALRVQLTVSDPQLEAIRILVQELTSRIETVSLQLTGEAPDLSAAVQLLESSRNDMVRLTAELLPAALDNLAADLASIDISRLMQDLDNALAPWLTRIPEMSLSLSEIFMDPLRSLTESIEAMTPEFLDNRFEEVEAALEEMFRFSEVGRLAAEAQGLLEGLTDYLAQIPLPQIREQLSTALLAVEGKIRSLESFSPVHQLADYLQNIESAIEQIDTAAIQSRVQEVAGRIQEVIDSFPIGELRSELESLVSAATEAVAGIGPALDEADQAIDQVAAQLTSIELDAAGEASVQLIRDIRQNIREALAGADLPDVARAALGAVAGEVRKIDLGAELRAPFTSVVARIDVAAIAAPLDEALNESRAALEKLAPSGLIGKLDAPFHQLVDGLEQLNPARLVDELGKQFEAYLRLLDQADPRVLITPLQAEFDRLIAELRQTIDPGPLLQPLKEAYQQLTGLIDRIDPSPLLEKILARISGMPDLVAEATGRTFTTSLGAGADLPTREENGPFRFGDILRPFAALIREIRGVVQGAAEELLQEGLKQISRPLGILHEMTGAGGLFLQEIGDILAERRGSVDFLAAEGPLADLREAIAQLTRVEASLAASGRSSFALGQAVALVQIDLHLSASTDLRTALDTEEQRFFSSLSPQPLAEGLQKIGSVLEGIVPPALLVPDTTATALARIEGLFDGFGLEEMVAEMDELGDRITAKLQTMAAEIAKKLLRLWDRIFNLLQPLIPGDLGAAVSGGMEEVRRLVGLLDPGTVEEEINELLEAVVEALGAYSPAAFAAELGVLFEAVKAKLGSLNPAALLGDLDPVGNLLEELKGLKPSMILAPLIAQTQELEEALAKLLDFKVGDVLVEAAARVRAELELIIENIASELDGLLGDLGAGDGEFRASASISIG